MIKNFSISLHAGHVHLGKLYHGLKCQCHTRSFRCSRLFPTSWTAETIWQTVLACYVKSPHALPCAKWLETALTSMCLVSFSSECHPHLTVDGHCETEEQSNKDDDNIHVYSTHHDCIRPMVNVVVNGTPQACLLPRGKTATSSTTVPWATTLSPVLCHITLTSSRCFVSIASPTWTEWFCLVVQQRRRPFFVLWLVL